MHICIFQTGEPLHIDSGKYRPMRAMLLADELIKKNHKVTLISSSFYHQRKLFRSKSFKSIKVNKNLQIILINSCGYRKNIGIKRIIDHIILSLNLYKFLSQNKNFIPDKIFLGYPPIETSLGLLIWANKKNIPVMIDIKDNWPENYIEPFPKIIRPFIKLILIPYFVIAKYIFRNIKVINSISEEFIEWIKTFSKNNNAKYLVSPLVRKPIRTNKKELENSENFWIKKNIDIYAGKHFAFVGSITKSFDFNFIFRSAEYLINFYPEYKFIICGTGDQFNNLINQSKKFENVFVFSEINKYHAKLLIQNSIATIAPYKKSINFQRSVPNKVIESLEYGVPFITNLDGKLKNLIDTFNNGIYIEPKNDKEFSRYLSIIRDKYIRKQFSINAKKSHSKLYNFHNVYDKLINEIIDM